MEKQVEFMQGANRHAGGKFLIKDAFMGRQPTATETILPFLTESLAH